MANPLASAFISSLTPDEAVQLARRYGVEFTREEAAVIVPFLKRHRNELTKANKNRLLNEGRNLVRPETYQKVVKLVDKFF